MSIKITAIGGGTGQPPILIGLVKMLHDLDIELSAVVGTWDNGGSSGKLRDLYGIMPPGDILKNIMALTPPENRIISDTLLRRFDRSYPKIFNHNAGNILLAAMQKHIGIIPTIRTLETLVGAKGKVYPITAEETTLNAEMTRVKSVTVKSEHEIDERLDSNYKISKLWLEPHCTNLPGLEAIKCADVLIISPGSIFTSIIPHFTIDEVRTACKKIPIRILISNLVDKRFTTPDYIRSMMIWSDVTPTHMIFNSIENLPIGYSSGEYKLLRIDSDYEDKSIKFISRPVLKMNDKLLRHDPKRTAAAITEILSKEKIL
jgi:uncharacterized cofD-like protein